MIKFVLYSAIFLCSYTYANPLNITIDDVKDMSLKQCLDINYAKLGLYGNHDLELNDRSYLSVWFAIDNDSTEKSKKLRKFIKLKTENYYLAKSAVKAYDANVVFLLCMKFYKSKILDDYIEENIFR